MSTNNTNIKTSLIKKIRIIPLISEIIILIVGAFFVVGYSGYNGEAMIKACDTPLDNITQEECSWQATQTEFQSELFFKTAILVCVMALLVNAGNIFRDK